jgi:hypothetical protein
MHPEDLIVWCLQQELAIMIRYKASLDQLQCMKAPVFQSNSRILDMWQLKLSMVKI